MKRKFLSLMLTTTICFGSLQVIFADDIKVTTNKTVQQIITAQEASIEGVIVKVNPLTKEVKFEGKITSGKDKEVSIVIKGPKGILEYINQITSGEDGAFSVSYKIKNPETGLYEVSVGGEGVKEKAKTKFVYDMAPWTPWEKTLTVASNHTFKVHMNESLNKDSVNLTTILVANALGQAQEVDVELDETGQYISIIPLQGYKEGEEYTLYITNQVSSITEKVLKEPIKAKFTIKN